MFTWICPKCGREVPPAYTECPNCEGKTAPAASGQPAGPPVAVPVPPAAEPPSAPTETRRRPVWSTGVAEPPRPVAPPPSAPPPPAAPPAWSTEPAVPPPQTGAVNEPAYTPQFGAVVGPPPKHRKMPTWLLSLLFALGFGALVFGVYSLVNRTPSKPTAAVESPAAKPGAPANPVQRYIEISGVRFMEEPKHKDQTAVKFVLTNHSDADLTGLAGNVTIWGSTRKSEEDAEGTFTFKTDLKPGESKELTAPLNTKKKIYELPDWQNMTTDVQITSPAG